MTTTDATVERGSGNVFADLDIPATDAHLLKAELVVPIDAIVRQRGITQTEAGRLPGRSQPDVPRLPRGDCREYSLVRLFRLLTALGRDPDLVFASRAPPPAASCASPQAEPADATAVGGSALSTTA